MPLRRTLVVAPAVLVLTLASASAAAAADSAGALDTGASAAIGTGFGPVDYGASIAVRTDDVVYMGGDIRSVDGRSPIGGLVRLRPDGSLDTAFATALGTGFGLGTTLASVAVRPDGGALVGGPISELDGAAISRGLVALTADGQVDPTVAAALGTGFDDRVDVVEVLDDGRMLVGGRFTALDGVPVAHDLVRLQASGALDPSFDAALGSGFDGTVMALAVQPDGAVVVGGTFTTLNGADVPDGLVRLLPDGTLDTAFAAALGAGVTGAVGSIALQPNGGILVGGFLTGLSGAAVPQGVIRLTSAGALDTAFSSTHGTGTNAPVADIVVQPDGAVVLVGVFTAFAAEPAGHILRLSSDGTRDRAFDVGAGIGTDGDLYAAALVGTDRLIASGRTQAYAGTPIPRSVLRVHLAGGATGGGAGGSGGGATTPGAPTGTGVSGGGTQTESTGVAGSGTGTRTGARATAGTGSAPRELAATGSEVAPLAAVAAFALVSGTTVLFARLRRTTRPVR